MMLLIKDIYIEKIDFIFGHILLLLTFSHY